MHLARDVAGAPLVRRVYVRVQEPDGQRLDAPVHQFRYGFAHLVLVELRDHAPVSPYALGDAYGAVGSAGGSGLARAIQP